MKMAAAYAIANLAKEDLYPELRVMFGDLSFGRDYLIPVPFDKRLMVEVSAAVANAAVESGVARVTEFDLKNYKEKLKLQLDA